MSGKKVMWQTKLTDLRDSDVEGLGLLREDEYGRKFRWVKNSSATALIAAGACLQPVTGVALASVKKVYTTDVGSEVTASVKMPAGVAMTGIAKSGGTFTGDHGWIQVKGPKRVNFASSDTAMAVGSRAIATSGQPASGCFDFAYVETANSATSAYAFGRYVQLLEVPTTDGAATTISGAVDINCL